MDGGTRARLQRKRITMTTLFLHTLDGMTDNNEVHDAQFSDWSSAQQAIETYKTSFDEDVSESEMNATVSAIQKIIDSNGSDIEAAKEEFNAIVWG